MRILLAEDEKIIARHVRNAFREEGHCVDMIHRGDEVLERVQNLAYDVVVLDIMMPGRDGLSVLRSMRQKRLTVPVLLLTARDAVSERVEGLRLGADDYLSKPFAMDELVARVEALARRSGGQGLTMLHAGDLSLNLVTREVTRAGKPIELHNREFALLVYLMQSPGRVLTRSQIIERVWEYHFDTGTNVVDVYIQRLRRKIDDGFDGKLLQTVRGVGYALKPPQ